MSTRPPFQPKFLPRFLRPVDAIATLEYEIARAKSNGVAEGSPRMTALRNSYAAIVEMIATLDAAEKFLVYLLTHAPELPDENQTVQRVRSILSIVRRQPKTPVRRQQPFKE